MSWDELAKNALSLGGSIRATMAVVCGICLAVLSSPALNQALGLEVFVATYRTWIGATCLVSGGFCGIHLLRSVLKAYRNWRLDSAKKRRLHMLADDEQAVLLLYIAMNQKTVSLPMNRGCSGNLIAMGILFRSSSLGDLTKGFPVSIQPWAWEYLRNHPECLGLPEDLAQWEGFLKNRMEAIRQQLPH